jgi:hypothetical protein
MLLRGKAFDKPFVIDMICEHLKGFFFVKIFRFGSDFIERNLEKQTRDSEFITYELDSSAFHIYKRVFFYDLFGHNGFRRSDTRDLFKYDGQWR